MVRTTLIVHALLVGLALVLAPAVRSAETEVRQFNVSVDGKPSGQYTMTIAKGDDGGRQRHLRGPRQGQGRSDSSRPTTTTTTAVEEWKDGRAAEPAQPLR